MNKSEKDDPNPIEWVSECCQKPVQVAGEGMTHWYVCSACGKATNPIKPEDKSNG